MKYYLIAAVLLCFASGAGAQGRKTVKEKGILSVTVEEYFLEEGMKEPVVESFERFNEDGERIELKEYNKRGEIKKWEQYVYDGKGQLIEEKFLDDRGKVVRTEKSVFTDGLRTEKFFYDQRGRLFKKKVYVYEYQ